MQYQNLSDKQEQLRYATRVLQGYILSNLHEFFLQFYRSISNIEVSVTHLGRSN